MLELDHKEVNIGEAAMIYHLTKMATHRKNNKDNNNRNTNNSNNSMNKGGSNNKEE
jgi:hypothetical protein